MKRKGFTLIELLAVIVILAILALITVPIVLKLVNNARKDSSVRSSENYLDGVKKAVMNDAMNSEVEFEYCEVQNDGNIICNDSYQLQVDVDGKKPTRGTINFSGGTISDVENLRFGKYYINGEVNDLVASTKATEEYRAEGEYLVGDKITYKGERYYVIKKAAATDEYLVLMKMYPLTTDEVVEYGLDSSGVNHAYKYDSGARNGTIGSRNGYGVVAFHSGEGCGYGYQCSGSRCDYQYVYTNCARSYNQSDIKVIVDNWAKDSLNDADLVEVDGYKVRLLSDADATSSLKFSTEGTSASGTGVFFKTKKTPKWVSSSDYYYWLMDMSEDVQNSAHIMANGYIGSVNVTENYQYSAGTVRPVINLSKAALTKENEQGSQKPSQVQKEYICRSTTGSGNITVGGKYECEVKTGTKFNFYVISNNGGKVELMMDRNICENGTAATDSNPCLYMWDNYSNNRYGPREIVEKLYNATKDWTKIPYSYFYYYDENRNNNSSYGYREFYTGNDYYYIYERNCCSTYKYFNTGSDPIRAHMPTRRDLYNYGYCSTNSNSCKEWYGDNLSSAIPGYWTLSTPLDGEGDRNYNALAVDSSRRFTSAAVNTQSYGIRPVITLAAGNLAAQ